MCAGSFGYVDVGRAVQCLKNKVLENQNADFLFFLELGKITYDKNKSGHMEKIYEPVDNGNYRILRNDCQGVPQYH